MSYPVFGEISTQVYNSIQTSAKVKGGSVDITQASSELVPWIRLISATQRASNTGSIGLIMSSNPDVPTFADYSGFSYSNNQLNAVTQTPSIYGGPHSSGMLGLDFDGKPVYPFLTPWTGDLVLRPHPLITNLEIKEGKDQISRQCTIVIKCFSLAQAEMLQEYFMEPGHTLFVEFGWSTDNGFSAMIDTSTQTNIIQLATNIGLDYSILQNKRIASSGDYDAFYGFIVGGSLASESDLFVLTIKLRGAPGLPVWLQGQHTILEIDPATNKVKDIPTTQTYSLTDISSDSGATTAIAMGGRRYKWMFNKLPGNRQTAEVKGIINKVYDYQKYGHWDLLNFDYKVSQEIANYMAGNFTTKLSDFFGQKEFEVGGLVIPKEKLVSENRYIRFGVALDILNANNGLYAYKMGGKSVTCRVNNYGFIGAFPNMFSTKPNKLIIPGKMPDFYQFYCNINPISAKDILEANFINNSISGQEYDPATGKYVGVWLSFVQETDLPAAAPKDDEFYNGFYEKAGYFGKLENLYINFDVFLKALKNSSNKSLKDVVLEMCNEMSSAVNSFWNLQIIEIPMEDGIKLQIVDENWRGYLANKKRVKPFFHSGEQSIFLEASLDIDIPAEMTNQIVLKRENYTSNPDSLGLDMGGLFGKSKDRFFDEVDYRKTKLVAASEKTKDPAKPTRESAQIQADIDALLASLTQEYSVSGFSGRETRIWRNASGVMVRESQDFPLDGFPPTIRNIAGTSEGDKFIELEKELANVKTEEKSVAETALSTNLNKIDVIPNPITNIIVPSTLKPDAGFVEFNKNFKIYTCEDTQIFDILKNNAFEAYSGIEKTSHPLPIKYNFKILGKSGLRRGDTFNIIGIPKKYRDYGFFQITEIDQTIEGNSWTTTVTGQYFQQLKVQ